MLGIGVQENEDVRGFLLCLGHYALYGCAFAPVFVVADYGGAGELGNSGRVIRASIINDDDLVGILLCLENHAADTSRFVIGRYAGQNPSLASCAGSLKPGVVHSASTSQLPISPDCVVYQGRIPG